LPGMLGLLLWLAITFGLFAWIICRRTAQPIASAVVLLLAPGSLINISYGQTGFLAGTLMCGGLLLVEEAPILAGVLIGLLSFKPQLGLLFPFVLITGGHFRAFAAAAATTILLLLGSLFLFGTTGWMDYIDGTMAVQRNILESGSGPAITTMPSFLVAARMLGLPAAATYGVQATASLLAVLGTIWVFRRRSVPLPIKASAVMVGAFIASPYFSTSDLCILAAAQVLLLSRYRSLSRAEYLLHALLWLLPLITAGLGPAGIPLAPLVLAAFFCRLLTRIAAEDHSLSAGAVGSRGPSPA